MTRRAKFWAGVALLATLAGMTWVLLKIANQYDQHYSHRFWFCTYACDQPHQCPESEKCETGLTQEQVLLRRMELTRTQLGAVSDKVRQASDDLREVRHDLRAAIDAGIITITADPTPEDGE